MARSGSFERARPSRTLNAAIVIAGCSALLAGSGIADVSGDVGERTFEMSGFDGVSLEGSDDVEIVRGEPFAVRAEGERAALQALVVESRDGTLHVRREDGDREGNDGEAIVRVTMPTIRTVSIRGSGELSVDLADGDAFDASLTGSGALTIADLRTERVRLVLSGSGDVTAAGVSSNVEIESSGSGELDVSGLRAERLEASLSGSGGIDAQVTGEASVALSGSGDVTVSGGAGCRVGIRGSGTVRCD